MSFVALPEGWTNIFQLTGGSWAEPGEEYRRACPGVFDTSTSTIFAYYEDGGTLRPVTQNPEYVRTEWFAPE